MNGMKKEIIKNWIRERISVLLGLLFVVVVCTWQYMDDARLDARFESGIGVDTTMAKIEFVKPGWIARERWYARYRTQDGREIRARFYARFEYPRNPYDAEWIKIVYLKDEVEKNRWIMDK